MYAVKLPCSPGDFSYEAADAIARAVLADWPGERILLDLSPADRTWTPALARLVLLRRRLRKGGGELAVVPPSGPARGLFDLCRMELVLPAASAGATARSRPPTRASARREVGFLGGLVRAMRLRVLAWTGGR